MLTEEKVVDESITQDIEIYKKGTTALYRVKAMLLKRYTAV